ncbi:MAG: putative Ig domain-containing protein [Pirellulaceae bacterium]
MGWNIGELGGTAQDRGTVTTGSAILREGDSFLVTLDQDLVIPQAPLNLSFTYEATFDTSDPASINDAFEAVLMAADGSPLIYSFAPERDAYFNLTEQMPRALGTGTTEEVVADGKRVSTDISQIPPGTAATLLFRLVNNDADVETTIHILDVQLTSGDDAPPVVTVGLTQDTAPQEPGSEPYRSDLLTNDPRVRGTATDDQGITLLEVQTDEGPFVDITAALANGQYSFDPGTLTPGPHSLKVRATDTLSQTSQSETVFTVNAPPVAEAGGNRTASEGDTVSFDGSGSTDTEDAIFRYEWGFDDGSFVSEALSSHAYLQDGTFPVSLTVIDTAGSIASQQIEVAVRNVAPSVLTATDLTGAAGAPLDFTATFSDPGVVDSHTALIHWGDGTTSAGAVTESNGQGRVSAGHTYTLAGTYSVRVEVTDDAGDSSDRLATAIIAAGETSSLAGYVYLDVNNNGVKDPPERVLPNVPITLSGIGSWTVVTAADGSYQFDNLPAGTYALREAQPLAFLDGRDTQGSPSLGSVVNDRFVDIELAADIHATGYNFGELGLRPELIGKHLFLASTPTAEQMIAELMVTGRRWFAFQASDTGRLTAAIPRAVDAPVIEVYTQGMLPVALSEGEHTVSVPIEDGATYVLHVAGQTPTSEFTATLRLEIPDPTLPPPAHPQYYTNIVNALDTNADGTVSPLDALVVINALNRGGQVSAEASLLFLDVTGDELLSPLDALWVINYLNMEDAARGEGESGGTSIVERADTLVSHSGGSIPRGPASPVTSAALVRAAGQDDPPEGSADSPNLLVSEPISETSLPVGQTLVLTGQASDSTGAPTIVRVNGQSVQVMDDAGNFFHQVQVAPGTNTFLVEARDAAGDTTSSTVTVAGTQATAGAVDFTQLSVVSGSSLGLYGRTSWQDASSVLYADFGVENIGQYTVNGPVLVGVTNISDPSVRMREAEGLTPEGIPYFDMSSLVTGGSLPPGHSSGLQTISFFAPQRTQFTYDLLFLAAVNQTPRITTVPDVEALTGHTYVYDVDATDTNGNALTFVLAAGPAGMEVNADTGRITWSPTTVDIGSHTVVVQVSDGRGGLAEQHYVLSAIGPPPNRPPLFTSVPVVDANVNVTYSYQGSAADPDDDALGFSIISGPAGLSVSNAGLVTWTPVGTQIGTHSVVLQVDDGRGGRTTQTYVIAVGQEPGNHAPLIVSDPVTQFNFLGPSNPPTGDVNPALLNMDLGLDESATKTVSLTLPGAPPVTPPPRQTFPLSFGSTNSGTIAVSFAEDNYTFSLAAPSLLYFDSLTNNGGLVWTLVGPAGTAVSSRPFTSSENSNPVLSLVAGDYTLKVVGADEATGTYQFRLSDLASRLVPALSAGTPQSGTLDPANETDLLSFTALAGDRFFFDAQARTGADNARWRLIDPYGNILFNQNLSTDVDTTTLTQTGAYTLLLEGSIADTGSGTYTINVQPVTTISQALTLGNVINGSIGVTGHQDLYIFNLAAPALLYFDALTNNASLTWTLTGPAGTAVSNRAFNSGADTLLNLRAGDYTLTVDGTGDATGAYQFRLFELAQASALTPGTPQSGTLSPGNESDLYRFSAAAGDKFLFDAQTSSGGNAAWRLIGPYGNILFNTNLSNDVNTLTLSQPGSYTLLLEGAIGNTGSVSYTFNVQPQGNVPPPPLTGTPLTLGTTVSDSIDVAGEQDRYLFTLAAPSLLYFDALTNNGNLNWTLVGPAGTAVNNRPFNFSDGPTSSGNPVLNLVAGTYQLTVAASGGNTGGYQFRLSDLGQANPLTPGTPLSDQLNPANETDLYRFTAAAGDRLYFDVQARTGASSARWRLVDPFGDSLFANTFSSDVDTRTLAQAGSYTLILEGHIAETGTGTYTINVQPVTDTSQTLSLGSVTSGSIGVSGEQDHYTFNLAAPGLFYFDALTISNSLNWTLLGPAGTAVTSRAFNSSDGTTFPSNPVLNLVAGAYTLTVDAPGDITGAYQFRLLDLAEATPFTPGTPTSGALDPANETDLLRFTASAGDRFFFDVTARSSGSQSIWRLVDPYGNVVFNTSFATASSSSDVETLTLDKAGSYTLLLEGPFNATGTDTYTINIQPVASPSSEAMTLDSLVSGSIGLAGEQDQYTFSLAAPAQAYFDALTNQVNLTWTLTGPARIPVHSRRFNESDIASFARNPVLDLAAGTYTLTVDGTGDFTGPYQFRLLNLAEAALLTPGTPVSGTLDPANETDLFRFTAAPGDKFFFDVQARSGATPGSWRLVDPSGTILFNKGFNDTGTFSDVDTLTLTQAGQYTLLLEGAVTNPGTSTYTINVQPVTFASQALTLGSLVSGSIGVPGEQDLYTFSLAAPAFVYFDALTNSGSATLTGPAGVAMNNLGFTATFPVLNLVAGDYTLTLDGFGDDTHAYQFRLSDLAQASPLAPGTPQSGTLDPAAETDLYRFTAAAGDQFFFDVQARSGATGARWRLVDPFGSILFNTGFNADVSTLSLTQPGIYTLLLEGFIFDTGSGSYTFNVQPMGNVPPTPLTGAPLTLGTTVSDSITVAGEQEPYLFTLAEPSLLYFDALTNSSNLNWSLVGPAGAAVSNRSFSVSDGPSLNGNPVLNLVAGTYQLTVAAAGSTTGAYQFRLSDLAQATPFTLGTPISGELNPGPETDLYTFSVAAAGRFASDFLNRTAGINLRLIDPFGNVVSGNPFGSNPGRQALNLERPGTYTLLVEGAIFNSGTGTYRLGVQKTPPVFSPGDVFVSVGSGTKVERYDHDLNFLDFLDTQTAQTTAGMAFDSSDNLYVTGFSSSNISRIEPAGTTSRPSPFATSDPVSSPESIVFDAAGNFYVGQADGTRDILKFSPDGILLDRFDVLRDDRGSDWIELAADQTTMFYTSEGRDVLRYDLNTHTQLPRFARLPGPHAYALRILPDNTVLVADSDRVVRLDESGQVIHTYTAPGVTDFFALNLDPDGTTFWSASIINSQFPNSIANAVFQFDISSGSILKSRQLPDIRALSGIAVLGETAAGTSRIDVVADDPAPIFANLSGPVAGIPGQPSTFQAQFTGDGEPHRFDLLFVHADTGTLLGSLPVRINTFYFYPVQAIDPDSDPLTYSLPIAPAGATIAADTGRITFDPPAEGDYVFRVQVDDGRGGQTLQDFTVHVQVDADNEDPVITSTAPTQAETGRTFAYAVTASDPDQDLLSFYLTTSPAGMSIDRTTGLVTWEPTAAQVGQQSATVLVLDGHGGRATQNFDVSVALFIDNQSPSISTLPPNSATAGKLYRYQAAATDPDNDALLFDLVVKPDGMAVDPRTALVFWQPEPDQVGSQDVILRVQDPRGGVDLQAFQVTVDRANTTPVITGAPSNSAVADLPYAYQVAAQDPDGDPLSYQLTTAPVGMAMDPISGLLFWTPTSAQLGSHAVTIAVSDGRGGEATQSFQVTVLATAPNHPPVFTSTPRTNIRLGSGYVYAATASDPDGDPLTFHLDQAPAGMAISAAGLITWTPEADQFGSNAVTARVDDGRGGSATQDFAINVLAQGSNGSPSILSQPPLNMVVGRLYRYDARAEDPDGDLLTWFLEVAPAGMSADPIQGTVRWTPTAADLGPQDVELRVGDAQGSFASQRFTINARGVNSPPVITSTPPTQAADAQPYRYVVGARDADDDPLSFTLTAGPAGMTIDASTGLIRWTPDISQVGQQQVEVRVEDGQGGAAHQSYTVAVSNTFLNRAPRITSRSVLAAVVNQPYQYQVTAIDADGDPLRFDVPRAPDGLVIDPATGLVQWTPDAGQVGDQSVVVTAADPAGNVGFQSYTLRVRAVNRAPLITSAPVTVAEPGVLYHYDLLASDQDGDPLTYTLVAGPAGAAMDGLGRVTWVPGLADIGLHHVSLRVADGFGEAAVQDYDIQVNPDSQAPKVSLLLTVNSTHLGEPVTVLVSTTDNVGVESFTLTANGVSVPLDSGGGGTLPADQPGPVTLVATAVDAAGNIGSAQETLLVIDPFDAEAPIVELSSPAADAVLFAPTEMVGTVIDDNLFFYKLSIAPVGSTQFVEFARGTTNVTDDVLGIFDPSLLQNDAYVLRLEATDAGGNVSQIDTAVSVAGDLKLGNFKLSFTDLSIPVAGIPITVTRTYDTLEASRQDDLGFGWQLEFRDVDLRTSVPHSTMEQFGFFNPFRDNTRVYVTLPGGRREGFTFQPQLNRLTALLLSLGAGSVLPEESWQYDPVFVPDAGVTSQLTLTGATTMFRNSRGEYFGLAGGRTPFNPANPIYFSTYTLATPDDVAYNIDASTGKLRSVTDTNGNTLTFTPDGVASSTGVQVLFERDPRGRITSVTDPSGATMRYEYDARGDLVAVTDREDNTTRFVYRTAPAHYLEQVIDPLGRTGVRAAYDAHGRLLQTIDALGNAVEFVHDAANSLETVKDQLGNVTTFEYDARGNILTQVDALGGVTRRTYDVNNNMLTETDALGRTTTFTYDDFSNVLTRIDPLGNATIDTYQTISVTPELALVRKTAAPFSRVKTSTDPLGNTTANRYDSFGNLVAQTDPLGNTTTTTYDAAGNPRVITDPLGNVAENLYDAAGYRIQMVDANGHVTNFTYDANVNPLSQTQLDGSGWSLAYNANGLATSLGLIGLPHTVQYDGLDQITQLTDPSGHSTTLGYDALGNLTQFILPDGTIAQSSTYDAVGNLVTVTDSLGNVTRYAYDGVHRLIQTTYADGSTENRTYDLAGQLVELTDALGNSTHYVYDGAGREIQVIDALSGVVSTQYDAAGRIVATTDPLGRTTRFQYDAAGQLVATVAPDGSTARNVFDADGRLVQTVNAAGHVTTNGYDPSGNFVSVTDALGNVTRYEYGDSNERVAITDANGNITRFRYDTQGHLVETTYPDGQTDSSTYDSSGRLASTTDGNGQTIRYGYDVRGRLISRRLPDDSQETYTYTSDGLVSTVSDAHGSRRYDYDPVMRRVVRVTEPDGAQVSYAYDAAGNRTSLTATVAGVSLMTTYTFDALHRLETVTDSDLGVTRYTYDAASNLTRSEFPNGTVETRSYDDLNRLLFLESRGPSGVITSHRYTLTPIGQRASIVEQGGRRVDYTYDVLNRLTREAIADAVFGDRTFDYTYDAVGNRLTRSDSASGLTQYSYDANDRLLTELSGGALTQFTYDDNGNMLSRVSATDQAFYEWDFENRLLAADTDGDGTIDVRNVYDDSGIRVSQTVGDQETRFLIDTGQSFPQVLLEYQPSGLIMASYVYGHVLISQASDGASSFYHVDGLGSTRALTDVTGAVLNRYVYDAFGRMLNETGSTPNSYLFAGQQRDSAWGLDYLRARYYDASTGRFVSRDTFPGSDQLPLSLNKYLYALADPVNNTDPSGEFSLSELSVTQAIQLVIKVNETAGKAQRVWDVVGRTLQAIGGVMTVHTAAKAFNDPSQVARYFGGVRAGANKVFVGLKSAGQLAKIGLRMVTSVGKTHYYIADAGGRTIEPTIYAQVYPFDPAKQNKVYLGLLWFTDLPLFPNEPLGGSRVGTLVHEFAHLASRGAITDTRGRFSYGPNAILFPPGEALRNAENYSLAVQSVIFGG